MHFQIYQFSWGSSIDLFDALGLHKVKLINSKIAMEFVQAYPTFKRQFVLQLTNINALKEIYSKLAYFGSFPSQLNWIIQFNSKSCSMLYQLTITFPHMFIGTTKTIGSSKFFDVLVPCQKYAYE